MESEAVHSVLLLCERGIHQWLSSTVIEEEISRNPDIDQRTKVDAMVQMADERLPLDDAIIAQARLLWPQGIRRFDALHVALAELHNCDLLFTVDDDLIRKARKLNPRLRVRVENPAKWLMESGA